MDAGAQRPRPRRPDAADPDAPEQAGALTRHLPVRSGFGLSALSAGFASPSHRRRGIWLLQLRPEFRSRQVAFSGFEPFQGRLTRTPAKTDTRGLSQKPHTEHQRAVPARSLPGRPLSLPAVLSSAESLRGRTEPSDTDFWLPCSTRLTQVTAAFYQKPSLSLSVSLGLPLSFATGGQRRRPHASLKPTAGVCPGLPSLATRATWEGL